jgi:NAD(P)-dependent dehydrogenase (short-subunit alcohol dehydrogenase family)
MRDADFAGRTALITGGGSGIGLALGAGLVAAGARVVLADVDGEAADRAAASMAEGVGRGRAEARELDVCDGAAFRAVVDDIGEVDLLFNNAGISMGGPSHELTAAHWDRLIDVNLRGVVNGLLAAYPGMVERRRGHIVNTASAAGLCAPPFVTAYATTKHAVVGLSSALRPEAALHGVSVTVLCPGPVDTAILDRGQTSDLPATRSQPVTPREYLRELRQAPMAAERFATRSLRQIARKRAIVVVPGSTRAPWYLFRLSPVMTDRALRSLARRVDRALIRPR